ncbi:hypothetical protein MYCTH_95278 [Thermothelomyces thermophilus ATCC 42464]|uniref:Uncharacterized protein n=1 Tax=Thermothelomyces thermophilus (strain ATCC 42464 / BCRC 31852 / DSM 1799) TaxID=573729 RepID=G2QGR0_THET4|nr:uncharacterized protein MYCTH_95278 [Thermothelomyces thermophilus ATCC 42464]AEO58622.1 hypothetical protein MYCTH_95278 [Thermothelomyces thermophilus ATCC 42464]
MTLRSLAHRLALSSYLGFAPGLPSSHNDRSPSGMLLVHTDILERYPTDHPWYEGATSYNSVPNSADPMPDAGSRNNPLSARWSSLSIHLPFKKNEERTGKLIPHELRQRLIFVYSPAETLPNNGILDPGIGGGGKTDLVLVGECIALLDASRALAAFGRLLRCPKAPRLSPSTGGPFSRAGRTRPAWTRYTYDRVAAAISSLFRPYSGTLASPSYLAAAPTRVSPLNNVALPASEWDHVVRYHSTHAEIEQGFEEIRDEALGESKVTNHQAMSGQCGKAGQFEVVLEPYTAQATLPSW